MVPILVKSDDVRRGRKAKVRNGGYGWHRRQWVKIMEKALKIAWTSRIQDESQAPWRIIPNQFLHKHGGLAFLAKCNFATSTLDLDDKLPTFYKKVLDICFSIK